MVLGILMSITATAQIKDSYESVILRDGSVLKGKVQSWDMTPNGVLNLVLFDGRELTISSDVVKKVKSRGINGVLAQEDESALEPGIVHRAGLGLSAGPVFGYSATYAIGYRHAHYLMTGTGIGLNNFSTGSGRLIIPVFAELSGFMKPRGFSPYYSVKVGYGFATVSDDWGWLNNAKGGLMFNPELGLRLRDGMSSDFILGLGLQIQKAQYQRVDLGEVSYSEDITFKRIELKGSYIF